MAVCNQCRALRKRASATIFSLLLAFTILAIAIGFNWLVKEHLRFGLTLSEKMQSIVSAHSALNLFLFSALPSRFQFRELLLFQGERYLGLSSLPLNGTPVTISFNGTYFQSISNTTKGTFSLYPVIISLQDTNGLISLTTYSTDILERLLKHQGIPPETRAIILDSLLDWIDPDDLSRLNGAERQFYQREGKPYTPRNYALQFKEELLYIRGMTPEYYRKLSPHLTILPNSGFNPNTATPEVLRAYLDLEDNNTLANLLASLQKEPVYSYYRLFQLSGKAPILVSEGLNFSPSQILEITLKVGGNRTLYTISSGIDLNLKTNTPYEILFWKEN